MTGSGTAFSSLALVAVLAVCAGGEDRDDAPASADVDSLTFENGGIVMEWENTRLTIPVEGAQGA